MNFKKEQVIFVTENLSTKEEVFNFMSGKFLELGLIDSAEEFRKGLLEREALSTTGFQDGFGIPHSKNETVKEANCVFFKLANPVEWDAMDGKPIDKLFCLGIPVEGANEHLQILSKIARKLMHEEFRDSITKATSEDQIFVALKEIEQA